MTLLNAFGTRQKIRAEAGQLEDDRHCRLCGRDDLISLMEDAGAFDGR